MWKGEFVYLQVKLFMIYPKQHHSIANPLN